MTQSEVASRIHVGKTSISHYENGLTVPDVNALSILADLYGVSLDYITGKSNIRSSAEKARRIGVIGRIEAGIPIEAIEDFIDWEDIPESMANTGEFFALQVEGHSMEPKMSPGDVLIVRRQCKVENGEIAIVMVNGDDATVKKVKYNDKGIMLTPTNPLYEPFFFSVEEVEELPVTILGKVVELRAKL
ncbi:MAG TPA: helix-turn-helix domain-containing protein [Thermoanaerobacterales bacterium]|nr:helix-turn-helix domain-containing protein [Thermoanaerobacterales bacterium]